VKKRLGLIINPIAGIGGRVGLKGSDGIEIQKQALDLGARPQAGERSIQSLELLVPLKSELELITYPGEMGATAAQACGFQPHVMGSIRPGETTAQDTIEAAQALAQSGVDLILFAGGDGTARDIYQAIGDRVPVLGIPAGVKIHSAAFATNPRSAGELAGLFMRGTASRLREAEVMDIDEGAVRAGFVSAQLVGYLKIPYRRSLVQSTKVGSSPGDAETLYAIASDVLENLRDDCLYIIGPGTTTRAILSELGLAKTLLGVDVVCNGQLIAADPGESQILDLIHDRAAKIILAPIGGQGYLFGRGNQQLSPQVIRQLGRDEEHIKKNLVVVSTPGKINALKGQPFLVDSGDREVDELLAGYVQVVTGYHERIVYKAAC
jgi:predicted polyphosphate/ATP-dependent NAD kinase